jgi:hypothetical protein
VFDMMGSSVVRRRGAGPLREASRAGHPMPRRLAADLESENRVILEVVPEKFLSYDESKSQDHRAGRVDANRLAALSDTDRQLLEGAG